MISIGVYYLSLLCHAFFFCQTKRYYSILPPRRYRKVRISRFHIVDKFLMSIADYGGVVATLNLLEDPLWTQETTSHSGIVTRGEISTPDPPLMKPPPSTTSISPTSLLNPFFGYPAFLAYGTLSLEHGRRRKRDLARTLLLLFWIRWRKVLIIGFLLAFSAAILKVGARGVYARSLRSFLARISFTVFKAQPKMGTSVV